jgi:hypothetical protein
MTTEVPAAAPAPEEPKPNPFARIIGVLFSPDATFASIVRRPDWVVPLIVLLVLSAVSGLIMAKRLDFAAPAREAMETNKNLSTEDAERMERMSGSIGKVISYAAPVFTVIILLLVAGILLLAFRLMGGEGTFKQAFSVTAYAWMPGVIKGIITLIIMVAKGGMISPVALATIVRSNLAFLVDVKTNPILFALLANLDIFSIWMLILFIIGFSYVARVSKAKSAAIIISLWIVKTLLGLIGPALQTLRK